MPLLTLLKKLSQFLIKTRFLIVALFILSGCGSPQPPSTAETSPSASISATPEQSEAPPTEQPSTTEVEPDESSLISKEGIATAKLGMTLAELKQRLGSDVEFTVKSPFIVDFDAIAVSQAGEIQYYILYLAGEPFTDTDVIQGLLTENPKYKTAEEVGPGTLIQQAEAVYGKATLSYNTENESREYARFEDQPAPNISFGTGNVASETAGVYASPSNGYNETQNFKEGATIKTVLVVCLDENCAGSR